MLNGKLVPGHLSSCWIPKVALAVRVATAGWPIVMGYFQQVSGNFGV